MVKRVYLLLVTGIFLFACSNDTMTEETSSQVEETSQSSETSESSEPENTDVSLSISDYYPMINNGDFTFIGEGNEYAAYTEVVDFIDGEFIQTRQNNGGTEVMTITQVTDEGVYEIFRRPETYVHENYIPRVQNNEPLNTIIEAPLEVGHSWETENGTREIVALDDTIDTPYDSFENVLVIEETDENGGVSTEYYAPDLGLVHSEYVGSEGMTVTSSLETLSTDGFTESLIVYQPNADATALEPVTVDIELKTNDLMREKLTALFHGELDDSVSPLFPEGTQILSLNTNWQTDPQSQNVYADFSEEIENVRGSTAVTMVYNAIFLTIADYYSTEQLYVTVNGEPLTIDQMGQLPDNEPISLEKNLISE